MRKKERKKGRKVLKERKEGRKEGKIERQRFHICYGSANNAMTNIMALMSKIVSQCICEKEGRKALDVLGMPKKKKKKNACLSKVPDAESSLLLQQDGYRSL